MLCTTPVDQSRSRQASFSYTAHHLAVYEKRQVTQNLFISTQCQGGSGKRKCSSTMSRLNIQELIEQRHNSLFRPGYKKRDTTQYSISLFYYQIFGGGNGFYGRFAEFFRMQRTLILYPRNIPEFVVSEDILSLQKVSLRFDTATDFQLDKKL